MAEPPKKKPKRAIEKRHQEQRDLAREERAFDLSTRGASYAEIGQALGISKTRAFEIVERTRGEMADEKKGRLDRLRTTSLERLRVVVRDRFVTLTAPCPACTGSGQTEVDGRPRECGRCRGTGRMYREGDRNAAARTIIQAEVEAGKMLGYHRDVVELVPPGYDFDDELPTDPAELDKRMAEHGLIVIDADVISEEIVKELEKANGKANGQGSSSS